MPSSSSPDSTSAPTGYLYFLIAWVVLAAFNYGFGISELNPIQSVLSCKDEIHLIKPDPQQRPGLPLCIPMNETQFGAVTALFTLGGLFTSLLTSPISNRFSLSPKSLLLLSASFSILGGGLQSSARGVYTLGIGRFIMGAGSGVGIVIVPRYLSDISPPSLRGSIGVLNQMGIVFGILTGQTLGVSPLGSPWSSSSSSFSSSSTSDFKDPFRPKAWYLTWRAVPLISALVALTQLLLGITLAVEPPTWIKEIGNQRKWSRKETGERVSKVENRLWKSRTSSSLGDPSASNQNEETVGLLQENHPEASISQEGDPTNSSNQLKISELVSVAYFSKNPHSTAIDIEPDQRKENPYRKGLSLILFTQIAQQLSGVNAVLYFSTGILTNVLSDGNGDGRGFGIGAKEVGVGITIINVLMTFPPIFLIPENRLGRKKLLLLSLSIMSFSSFFLSLSILNSSSVPASIFIILFVAGFSIGLGPIPFLILPELVPENSVNSASSLGMGLNWIANFFLALGFLPLKNFFKSLDGMDGGSVFFIFTVINAITFVGVWRYYRYEEEKVRDRLD